MSTKPEYDRGYDDACRGAVEWLHRRASVMTDGHARQLLHGAATNLGWDTSRARGADRRPRKFDNTDADIAMQRRKG